jgi:signal peptidase I
LAIPGDEVVIEYGQVYLNGVKYGAPFFVLDNGQYHSIPEAHDSFLELCNQGQISALECATLKAQEKAIFGSLSWKIPDNQFFVIGDNAFYSFDSKNYGFIGREKIKSKLVCYGINSDAFELKNLTRMGVSIH